MTDVETGHHLVLVILVVLAFAAIFSAPTWGYSRAWGPYPSGGLGIVFLILLLLLLFGRI